MYCGGLGRKEFIGMAVTFKFFPKYMGIFYFVLTANKKKSVWATKMKYFCQRRFLVS